MPNSALDVDGQQQPQRIDQHMALTAFNLFSRIIAFDHARLYGGLHTLAIEDSGGGNRMRENCTSGSVPGAPGNWRP